MRLWCLWSGDVKIQTRATTHVIVIEVSVRVTIIFIIVIVAVIVVVILEVENITSERSAFSVRGSTFDVSRRRVCGG
jgi:uncharacterized protein HemY